MFLSKLIIKNFRGIKSLELKFDDNITVLIGENNSGKSTILDAIQYCLGRSLTRKSNIFTEYDYYLTGNSNIESTIEVIEIILYFTNISDSLESQLRDCITYENENNKFIILSVKSPWKKELEYNFLNENGEPLSSKANKLQNINLLQQFSPVFYLAALRDSAQEFSNRSPFWKPFINGLNITEDEQTRLENALFSVNQEILNAHGSFEVIKEKLAKVTQHVPLGLGDCENVTIEAIPQRIFDMLSRTQVMLTAKTGARLPIKLHGEGTQSLAVICLFEAFLQAKLTEEYKDESVAILELEEPEAHLHPSAIRNVINLLKNLSGQKIITTHSGDLVAGVSLTSLRRLRRENGEIKVYQLEEGVLPKDDIHKLNYHVRQTRGYLLFARCWLLVEGETEPTIFNECARIMGYDLFSKGICCVEYAQVGVEKFIKLADQLGIEWLVVADKDNEGSKYISSAEQQLNNRSRVQHLYQLEHGDMEVFLCMNGYNSIFESNKSPQKEQNNPITANKSNQLLEYCKQLVKLRSLTKPQAALAIVQEIEIRGVEGVPQQIQTIIKQAIQFAEKSS
jgi:putative ATP-dependent endonuclease of OLD family